MAMKGVLQTFKRRFSKESSLGVGSGSGSLQRGASGGAHSGDGALNKKDLLQPLPSFRECPASERQALMIKKLKLCSIVFDFSPASDPGKDNLGKEMKRQVLLELVDHISTTKAWFSEAVLQEIINMIQANLFRALPPSPTDAVWDPEEDDPVLDPAWAHLQIVYEFLLRFVVSSDTDTKLVKKYINGPFVLRILDLFMSEDPRERDYLKTILHRIYGKFMSLRSFIRKAINNVFFTFIYDSERHNGVGELLEILGSIINGFALPLKEEHKRFLKNVLIPLHKVRMLALFHQQLAYCVTQFIDKDPLLAPTLILGILQYWPITNSSKEVLFLNELEEILELTQPDQFQLVIDPLFRQIAKSIASPHFQVAERALFMWNNEYISSLTTDFRKRILPILYPALHANSKKHWNSTVHSLTFNVIRMFMEMDSDLFDSRSKKYTEETSSNAELSKKREEMWDQLEKQAQQKKLAGVA
ncbi:Serine/threonine protein phosphatase 2A regulatory subunit [Plasmodiophora brassicae]|uniref:Serine/threonine protein phosphatase 2A regulatory subunit n=1 Tax=Plasmodiophora brassicae TaxID=37360 RepID=A0A0G4ILD2_PLABS|nr:hypothetical protein PBRA_004664 [Plasmodiophora brassicae]SPQ93479.1 unnamed protein product [Plasmodiophora brassicae]